MINTENIKSSLTKIYTNLVFQMIQSQNPHFNPGRANIYYDEDDERYIYSGFTDNELQLVNKVLPRLLKKSSIH